MHNVIIKEGEQLVVLGSSGKGSALQCEWTWVEAHFKLQFLLGFMQKFFYSRQNWSNSHYDS